MVHVVALALVYSACPGNGRRLQVTADQFQGNTTTCHSFVHWQQSRSNRQSESYIGNVFLFSTFHRCHVVQGAAIQLAGCVRSTRQRRPLSLAKSLVTLLSIEAPAARWQACGNGCTPASSNINRKCARLLDARKRLPRVLRMKQDDDPGEQTSEKGGGTSIQSKDDGKQTELKKDKGPQRSFQQHLQDLNEKFQDFLDSPYFDPEEKRGPNSRKPEG